MSLQVRQDGTRRLDAGTYGSVEAKPPLEDTICVRKMNYPTFGSILIQYACCTSKLQYLDSILLCNVLIITCPPRCVCLQEEMGYVILRILNENVNMYLVCICMYKYYVYMYIHSC